MNIMEEKDDLVTAGRLPGVMAEEKMRRGRSRSETGEFIRADHEKEGSGSLWKDLNKIRT